MNNTNQNPVRSIMNPSALTRKVYLITALVSTASMAALELFARCPDNCASSVILRLLLSFTAMLCACGFINAVSGFRVWKSVICSAAFFLLFSALNAGCSILRSLESPDNLYSWITGKIGTGLALYLIPLVAVLIVSVLMKKRYTVNA